MAEPYHIPEYNDDRLPERLKAILYALANYHQYILQKYTLETQNPNHIHQVEKFLRNQCNIIINAVTNGITNEIKDDKLLECISILRENYTPYSYQVESLLRYWCHMMFEQYPFSISHNHIQKLYENSVQPIDESNT
jgi:hypothetical protein